MRASCTSGSVAGILLVLAVAAGGTTAVAQPQPEKLGGSHARVECAVSDPQICRTDLITYIGWRVFDRYCASCHGTDALGTSFAPSLAHRVRQLDRRAFFRVLDEGYTGRFTSMRPWGEHPEVGRYYEELWAYLSARASGRLPPVPLEPLRERE